MRPRYDAVFQYSEKGFDLIGLIPQLVILHVQYSSPVEAAITNVIPHYISFLLCGSHAWVILLFLVR